MAPFDVMSKMNEIGSFTAGRKFEICRYYTSMSTLLIRSAKRTPEDLNVDIVFWSVSYISLSTSIGSFEVVLPTVNEVEIVERAMGRSLKERWEKLFVIIAESSVGYVVGMSFSLSVNDGSPGETPSLPVFPPHQPKKS